MLSVAVVMWVRECANRMLDGEAEEEDHPHLLLVVRTRTKSRTVCSWQGRTNRRSSTR